MNTIYNLNTVDNAVLNFELETMESKMIGSTGAVSWAKSNILEAIDHHAENLTDADTIVQIPELEITLNLTGGRNFLKDSPTVQAIIWDQIYDALKKAIQETESISVSVQQHRANFILNYLKTGQVREYYEIENWNALVTNFFEELPINTKLRGQWLEVIQNESAFVRFFRLLTPNLQNEFIARLTRQKEIGEQIGAVLNLVSDHPQNFRPPISIINFYHTLFQSLPVSKPSATILLSDVIRQYMISNKVELETLVIPKEIESVIAWLVKDGSVYKEMKGPKPKKSRTPLQELERETPNELKVMSEGIYIAQAGLVLLTPFLTPFLKNTGYLGKKGQPLRQHKIPIVLHYLATGEREAPEWKLTLPKILAGLRPGEHCDTSLRSSKKLDLKIDELLTAVIGHWEALKNTSPDGLRATFLNREGELRYKNGFYYLNIKDQTVDILLNYVSWNYSTIRLNWMNEIILVEWNKI